MAVVSLPMYDLPEIREATDAWWSGLAGHIRNAGVDEVPARLNRAETAQDTWRDPALLFSQTCGYPLTHEFRDTLGLVATPAYRAPGCSGADYCSYLVVRDNAAAGSIADLYGSAAAVNAVDSQSGCNALFAAAAPYAQGGAFFSRIALSGAHADSIAMVRDGGADVAAIDAVTLALIERYRPAALRGIRRLAETPAAPGLPYVTRGDADGGLVDALWRGLQAALADPLLADARDALLIAGAERLAITAYDRILAMEKIAGAAGLSAMARQHREK
ncbi:MAG: PhnD/SsuA/transferrin family substrate-binding protein [Minwuiales bacterium]|nr:PhnD/SsuA/transferrin family substrate-binding protein [Minwuiales bacterium]